MKKYLIALPIATMLFGCSTVDVRTSRIDDNSKENREKIDDTAKIRSKDIRQNETYFTEELKCIGEIEDLKRASYRVSVAPIYDKTQKAYPAGSTAISDMVINALSYADKAINIVETPLGGDLTESRVDIMNPEYDLLIAKIKDQTSNTFGKANHLPFGVLFPSHYHITGALIQYDEGIETLSPSINLNIDAFNLKRDVSVFTVGIQLRLINSLQGEIATNTKIGARGSVILLNKFYKISLQSGLFRLVNTAQYGLDYSAVVADPKHYAIQEMVEKGVAELISGLPGISELKGYNGPKVERTNCAKTK